MQQAKRNVFILSAGQALALSGATLVMAVSALAGTVLAPTPWMVTLPLALQFLATMVATIPASLLMGRIGRRPGFMIGQGIGIVGALVACAGLLQGWFWVFAAGSILMGVHNSFWQYFRFAAADVSDEGFRPRAIAYVMAGGLVAALLGPELAKATRTMLDPVPFAGSYLAVAALCLISVVLLSFLRIPGPPPRSDGRAPSGRPLAEIARQPKFVVAVLAAMIGYGVMNLVMVATPLAMAACSFEFSDAAFVIQWHVVGMFLPSFFTGNLIKRFGVLNIILAGAVLNIAAMGVNLAGQALPNFWLGLVLLGLGWNFMFIGGTTLLTETYRPEERSKAQACNDFLVFTTVAASSFLSGAVQDAAGWDAINAAMSIPVLLGFAAVVWLMARERKERTASLPG
ncbi:MAG: MFS transporter [Rhodospirillaceae bacterium]